jgi:hypothetical protein
LNTWQEHCLFIKKKEGTPRGDYKDTYIKGSKDAATKRQKDQGRKKSNRAG